MPCVQYHDEVEAGYCRSINIQVMVSLGGGVYSRGGVCICVCGRCIYSDHSMWEGVYATLPIYNLLLLMDICSIWRYGTAIYEYNMQ
jgi:hypothetical protein